MTATWILTADRARARIFTAESSRGPLIEMEDLVHPEARLRAQGLTSDAPGRTYDGGRQGGHTVGHEDDPGRIEAERFAKEVCEALSLARKAGRFEKLYVVAAPTFLGLLRECLDPATRRLVAGELDKNLAAHAAAEIRAHLPERL